MVTKNTKIAVGVVGGLILLPRLVSGGQQRPSMSGGGGSSGGFFSVPFGVGEPVNPNSTTDNFGTATGTSNLPDVNIYESSDRGIGLSNAGTSKKAGDVVQTGGSSTYVMPTSFGVTKKDGSFYVTPQTPKLSDPIPQSFFDPNPNGSYGKKTYASGEVPTKKQSTSRFSKIISAPVNLVKGWF